MNYPLQPEKPLRGWERQSEKKEEKNRIEWKKMLPNKYVWLNEYKMLPLKKELGSYGWLVNSSSAL